MSATAETLRKARARIADPADWTQGVNNDGAGRVCAMGALEEVPCPDSGTWNNAYEALNRAMGHSVVAFNDTHTHAEVLAAFDRAIEIAEAKE